MLLRQHRTDAGPEVRRQARRRVRRVDDLGDLLLFLERPNEVRLRINVQVCLRLIDEQNRSGGQVSPREKAGEAYEHSQARAALVEWRHIVETLLDYDPKSSLLEAHGDSHLRLFPCRTKLLTEDAIRLTQLRVLRCRVV